MYVLVFYFRWQSLPMNFVDNVPHSLICLQVSNADGNHFLDEPLSDSNRPGIERRQKQQGPDITASQNKIVSLTSDIDVLPGSC